MNFSENISEKLSGIIANELQYNADNKEILAYAIETMLLFILGSAILVLFGFLTNALFPIITAALFGGLLRRFSGGAHFDTPLKCLVFGSVVYISIGILAKNIVHYDWTTNRYLLIFMLLLSLFIVIYFAPVDSEFKPISSVSLKFKLKVLSACLVFIALLLVCFTNNDIFAVSIVLGVVYQCITLFPNFNDKRRWK